MSKPQDQIPSIIKTASAHMRKLAASNVQLAEENEKLAHELLVMKLARRMEQRELQPHLSLEEKIAGIAAIPTEKLASFEQAVELTAGGFSFGTVDKTTPSTKTAGGELYTRGAVDVLDNFVMSQQAFAS